MSGARTSVKVWTRSDSELVRAVTSKSRVNGELTRAPVDAPIRRGLMSR